MHFSRVVPIRTPLISLQKPIHITVFLIYFVYPGSLFAAIFVLVYVLMQQKKNYVVDFSSFKNKFTFNLINQCLIKLTLVK